MKERSHSGPPDTHWEQPPLAGERPVLEELEIRLRITEPELVAEIASYPEGRIRDDYIRTALRIGILALRQAEGQIDSQAVRNEGERLLQEMAHRLDEHRKQVTQQIAFSLREYFDPADGRFPERLERLLKKDGELEQVLRRQVGEKDSVLVRTLGEYLGDSSQLMKQLSREDPEGFLQGMNDILKQALEADRERILGEFSLDRRDSALNRLVRELNESHGKLTGNLQESIKAVVSEFSLDNEGSALSRLVSEVANQYSVRTFPTRGYPSFTYVQRMASYIRKRLKGKKAVVLYFGDFDPSGVDIERDLTERLRKYGAGDFTVRRVALTPQQIVQHRLPPMPVKKSDARAPSFVAAYGNEAVELDALEPNVLKLLVARSIAEYIDLELWRRREAEIESLRRWIRAKLEDMENLVLT